jgi:hypothetical protein
MREAAMILRTDSKYPNRRAYVLKLHSDATPDDLYGRLENLVTSEHLDFGSAEELCELIARDIETCTAEPARDR